MWDKFQKEIYGRDTITSPDGFICFEKCKDDSVYLHTIYIKPDKRESGAGMKLLNTVIEVTNPTHLSSYVDLTTKNPELSILAHLKAGFKILESNATCIIFHKEVNR